MRTAPARTLKSLAALLAAVLAMTGLTVAPAASAATSDTISGHVYLGSAATPAGPSDAIVEFTKVNQPHNASDFVTVAADGSYSITGLTSGSYTILAKYIGSAGYGDMYWLDIPLGAPISWADSAYPGLSGVDITLGAPAAISGLVKLGNFGSTYAGAGDVAVYYSKYVGGVAGAENPTPVYTDATGRFTFPSMSSGMYTFRFDYLGTLLFLDTTWAASGVFGSTQGQPVTFTANVDYTTANVTLPPTSTVSGTVRLRDDAATSIPGSLAGAGSVSLQLSSVDPTTGALTPVATTTTNSSGGFQFTGLGNTKDYKVTATYLGAQSYHVGSSSVISRTGGTANITLLRAFTVTGHIYLGDSSVSAEAGEVTVTYAEAPGQNYVSGYGGSAVTDADGNYSIAGLAGQNYYVTLTYNGTRDYRDTVPVLPTHWSGHPGMWKPTSAGLVMNFTVDLGNVISGTVTNSTQQAIAGASVYAVLVDSETGDFIDEVATATDSLGKYEFHGLADGYYVVQFEAAGYAPQSYAGQSYYYAPAVVEVADGSVVDGIDAVLFGSATISGQVTGPNLSSQDFLAGHVWAMLQLFDESTGEWSVVDFAYLNGGGNYFFTDLSPDRYRVIIRYSGVLGMTSMQSPVLVPGEHQTARFSPVLKPGIPKQDGTVVRGPTGTFYMTDSFDRLFVVRSLSAVTDSGRSGAYTNVTQEFISNYVLLEQALSSVWVCDDQTYLAAEGKLWPISEELVAGLPRSELSCWDAPKSATTITGPLFLTSPAGKTYLIDEAGAKHQALTTASMNVLSAPNAARAYKVNDAFLNSLPTGPVVLPVGAMVRAPNQRVYLVSSFNHLVPVLSFDVTTSMGLPATYTWVTTADLVGVTVDPDSQALSEVVVCGGVTYFASLAKLYPVDAALVAGLPKTALDAPICGLLPKATQTVSGALFVQSLAGGAIWQIQADGSKRQVLSTGTMTTLASPAAPLTLRPSNGFITARPTGAVVLPVGSTVRAPNQRVYFVAGFNHLVPILTWDVVNAMGLPSTYTWITNADLAGVTVDPDSQPLADVVVCGSVTYFASLGKLVPVDAALVAGLPQTTLDASACALLPKSTQTVSGALFVQSLAGGATWQVLADGSKRQVLSVGTMTTLASPAAPVTLRPSAAFIAARPTGPMVLPVGSMVRAPNQRVYLVSSFNHLVPVLSFDVTTSMGLPATYTWITTADLVGVTVDPDSQALSEAVTCSGATYFASLGKLYPVDAALVAGVPKTALDAPICALLPKATQTVSGALFVQSLAGGAIFQIQADGSKRQVLSAGTMTTLASPAAPVTLRPSAGFITARPTGPMVLPVGSMVRAPNQRVYLVSSFTHLVPVLSFDVTAAMGLPATYTWITTADLVGVTVDPDSQALSEVVVCGGVTYFSSLGKLYPVDAALVAGLTKTALDAPICALLPKATQTVSGALFVQSLAGGAIWQIQADGSKRQVLSAGTMTTLASPAAPVTLRPSAAFISARPTGPMVLPVGAMVRAPNQRVYLVSSFTHLVPVLSFDVTSSLGLPATYTWVTTADLVGVTVDPDSQALSEVVLCGGLTYFASLGKLYPVDAALVAGVPKTALDAPICALLPKATQTVSGALFVQSLAGGAIWQVLADGSKRQVLSIGTMTTLAAPAAPVTLRPSNGFITARPTGQVVMPVGSTVRAPNQRAYFVAGFNHLVPILAWDVVNAMGLPSTYTWVTNADLVGVTVDPDSQPLADVLVCGSVKYFASLGKLVPVDAALVAGLPQTTLDASACALVPKSTQAVSGAMFVQSLAGGAIWQVLADGSKRQVLSVATMTTLTSPAAPVTLRPSNAFIAARPTVAAIP